ncbi:hypothetical protein GOB93_07255 [Acetobacter musti]|uniref:Uncharacterized protein n=1 Tax=Acetobacter musti TaxID=864732 RepID=A0ABX0JPL2_9PROT|nr:hypothetical protein [Acetobacter musti]NHN84441.1 hypothetical protein [Acetobacter musti]
MRKSFRSLMMIPALAGVLAGTAVLPATAGAHGYDMRRGGPGWHGPRWGGPHWGGPPPGARWHRGPGWGPGAVVGGVLGGVALGALAGAAIANTATPPVAYAPPVYAAPAPYPVATPYPSYPAYSPYGSW